MNTQLDKLQTENEHLRSEVARLKANQEQATSVNQRRVIELEDLLKVGWHGYCALNGSERVVLTVMGRNKKASLCSQRHTALHSNPTYKTCKTKCRARPSGFAALVFCVVAS